MSSPPYGKFQRGGTVLPLPTQTGNALLRDSDPPLFFILDYFQFEIRSYIGDRFLQEAAASGYKTNTGQAITDSVAMLASFDPEPYLSSTQFAFPLLAIWRRKGESRQETASYEGDKTSIGILYALPPFTAGQMEQLGSILPAVYKTLSHQTTQGFDPAYTPPGVNTTLGEVPWNLALAGLEEIGLTTVSYGRMPAKGSDMGFPAVLIEGYIVERDNYVKTGGTYSGADLSVDLLGNDGTQVPIISGATQNGPTLTSLNVTSGPVAGGTTVVLTGSLFVNGQMGVFFGAFPATHVVWTSSTSVMCTTPAMLGAGVVGVTFIDHNGLSANLPASFAFV